LTDAEIRRAVARGQGRAILFLRDRADSSYFDLILELCSRVQSIEPYTDGRTDYLCRLAETLPAPGLLVQPLGELLLRTRSKWLRAQIRRILGHARTEWNPDALGFLLRDFDRLRPSNIAFYSIVDLAGLEGLRHVARNAHRFEQCLLQAVFEDAVEAFGRRATLRLIRQEVKQNPGAQRLTLRVEREYVRPPKTTAAGYFHRLREGKSIYGFKFVASGADWAALARVSVETRDAKVARQAARALSERPWPLELEAAVDAALAEGDLNVRRWKLVALKSSPHPRLRAWALEQLAKPGGGDDVYSAFRLLEGCARPSDMPAIAAGLRRLARWPGRFESAQVPLRSFRCRISTEVLRMAFDHGPCPVCRYWVVMQLVRSRALTTVELEELTEDADEDTRALARRILHRRAPRT